MYGRRYGERRGYFAGGVSLVALVAAIATAIAVYDPSDLSSLFQGHYTSSAGQAVATADDQQIAMILDKKQMAGKSAAEFVAMQPELRANGTVGLTGAATAATYNTATGEGTATRVDGSNLSRVQFTLAYSASAYRFDIENTGSTVFSVRDSTSTAIVSVNAGSRITVYLPQNPSFPSFYIIPNTNGQSVSFTVHSVKHVPGYHRSQATSSKRPKIKISGELSFILYDGIDDCLPTIANVDFGGDAVTLCIGLTKLSDAAAAAIVELGALATSVNGSWNLIGPNGGNTFTFASRGTANGQCGTGGAFPAPVTGVFTAFGDISADLSVIRKDGVQVATTASDQGTGNYTPAPVNFGSRNNGASAPFNGREYSSALFSSVLAGADLSIAERWCAQRAGVVI